MFKKVWSKKPPQKLKSGQLLVVVLIFGAVFLTILGSVIGYIVTQNQLVNQRVQLQKASDIAEAGLNYYKWFLAHNPNDITDGTGLPGPYVHTFYDPEGGAIGEFSLEISNSIYCGSTASIDVSSTGYTFQDDSVKQTITARYSRPTVAEYSFIINSEVWAGPDREIIGPYHSNQGIRMDGTNRSIVTSNQENWFCKSTFGCSPEAVKDGVFTTTANSNPALFSFPSAPISFEGITVDLKDMKDQAVDAGGIFLPKSSGYGYQIILNANKTITVRQVTGVTSYQGYTLEDSWQPENNVISASTLIGNYTISDSCPLIFVEDKVWLEGVVEGKVTLAAANISNPISTLDIILNDNITYASATSSGLLAIAENNVLLGLKVPNNMFLNGIFIAQNGRLGRNHYTASKLPNSLKPYVTRDSVTMNGTTVSMGRVGTQWTSGGVAVSGFLNRYNSYDRNLVYNPPPMIPKTSDVYTISDWSNGR